MPSKELIKNNSTHIAHGLNPSTSPITIDIKTREVFLTSILPRKGKTSLFSLLTLSFLLSSLLLSSLLSLLSLVLLSSIFSIPKYSTIKFSIFSLYSSI